MELLNLTEYGLAGVAIALIVMIIVLGKKVLNLLGNHIDHNTQAWNKNCEILTRLDEKIGQDIEVGKETNSLLRNKNGK